MILHFDDCPHNCNKKGKLFDRALGRMVDCSHCKERRKELAVEGISVKENVNREESLHEVLGFTDKYLSHIYSFEALFPKTEFGMLEDITKEELSRGIEELRGTLANGEVPQKSYCFGLSRKGTLENLAYPLMVSSYLAGITSLWYSSSRLYYNDYIRKTDVRKYYETSVLFLVVASGASYDELITVKGLLETRASLGLPTIILTLDSVDSVSMLLGYQGEASLYLASPYFAERSKVYDTSSIYTDKRRGRGYSMEELMGV